MMTDALGRQDSRIVLADEASKHLVEAGGFEVIMIDELSPADEMEVTTNPVLPAGEGGSDRLAYVIYTSGITGHPKGVLVPDQNVIRLLTATDPLFGFRKAQEISRKSGRCFTARPSTSRSGNFGVRSCTATDWSLSRRRRCCRLAISTAC